MTLNALKFLDIRRPTYIVPPGQFIQELTSGFSCLQLVGGCVGGGGGGGWGWGVPKWTAGPDVDPPGLVLN